MPGEFFDVGQWKETKSGKNFLVKLGSAVQNEDGGWTIFLDALPMPGQKGGCKLAIVPKRQQSGGFGGNDRPPPPRRDGPDDDSVPF